MRYCGLGDALSSLDGWAVGPEQASPRTGPVDQRASPKTARSTSRDLQDPGTGCGSQLFVRSAVSPKDQKILGFLSLHSSCIPRQSPLGREDVGTRVQAVFGLVCRGRDCSAEMTLPCGVVLYQAVLMKLLLAYLRMAAQNDMSQRMAGLGSESHRTHLFRSAVALFPMTPCVRRMRLERIHRPTGKALGENMVGNGKGWLKLACWQPLGCNVRMRM